MTVLWTAQDAAEATSGTATAPFEVSGLSIDTRSLVPGDLFIALTDQRDGHDFVANAFAAGATAALVSHRPDGVAEDAPLLIVDDVLRALGDLARAARKRTCAKVIGITGSVGKTSTKDMLRHALAGQGRVHAAERSFNNHWGVPLTLARCPADADFAVIEIGMNHPGEIAPLARLADLDAAVITTVAAVHLEAFADGIDGIAREKAAIFAGLRSGGTAIVNGDTETAAILCEAAQEAGASVRRFGTEAACVDQLLSTNLTGDGTQADIDLDGQPVSVALQTMGRHFAMNAVATLAAVRAVGGDVAQAAADLADWVPTAGRGTNETLTLPQGAITLLDDAYNANPTSVAAALEVLAATAPGPGGRRIAVLGDMLELGPTEAALHTGLAALPTMEALDQVYCIGTRMGALDSALPARLRAGHFPDATAAIAAIPAALRAGDVVMVKGSLGSKVSELVTALRAQGTKGT